MVISGGAVGWPAWRLWDDAYLSAEYGSTEVDVEYGKKENRSLATARLPLREFLREYGAADDDRYCVWDVRAATSTSF